MFKVLKITYRLFNVLIILTLLSIHFIIKDRTFHASLWFYTLPLPVIIVIILGLSILLGKYRRYNLILAGILTLVWLGKSFNLNFTEVPKNHVLEVVFWNASRDNGFESAFKLNGGLPDLMVLTETSGNNFDSLQAKYPDYYFYNTAGGLELFSKKPIQIKKENMSKFHSAVVQFQVDNINFYAVDMQGSTDVPRSWEFAFLDKQIKETQNTMIIGDFNLPYESILFKYIKSHFYDALTKKGNGFRETWFWNLPLLSLDHIWASNDMTMYKAEKTNTDKSDHTMIKAYIKTN
ncbi:endonuclease/exonuclease/phosphatase family protein [Gaetbulibacter aestuarii]|uniref:Endonuclease/exonuclease/phosphatase family protein n=1 Tax=Gaetbulibacter aestuarii TaxID=1502358 RepID=A0ABW7MVE5_9FLAO